MPLPAGDQLGESGLSVSVGKLGFELRRIPVEGVDFPGAYIAHEQRRIVRS